MRMTWLLAIALSVAPSVAMAGAPGGTPQRGETASPEQQQCAQGQTKTLPRPGARTTLALPESASLVGESQVTEIRELPELDGTAGVARCPSEIERMVGVTAADGLYQTGDSYASTVAFFACEFRQPGYNVRDHTVAPGSTAWSVTLPQGGLVALVVRNTTPTTIEAVEGTGAETQMPECPETPSP